VSKGETRVTWQAPQLDVTVNAPKTLGLNQDATVTYSVAGSGKVEAGAVTLTARVPPEMVLIKTDPKAAVDGETLIWSLPPVSNGKPQTVTAVVRPVRMSSPTLTADARTEDGVTGRGSCPVTVTEAKLHLKLDGPATGMVSEVLPFRVTVSNAGDGPAQRIRIQGRFDDGLEAAGKTTLDETIDSLGAGQSKTIALPLSSARGGKFGVEWQRRGEALRTKIQDFASKP